MNKFPHIKQPDSMECGATCLRMIAKFHGKEYSAETDAKALRCLSRRSFLVGYG